MLGRPWDAVYVSHLHADHFDRKFLAALARRQPECTVVIPHFAHSWLRRAVESCGFPPQQIAEVGSGDTQKIGDIEIQILAADHCDPKSCGISVPCHQGDPRLSAIDSFAIFAADGVRILNANDSLAVASVGRVLPKIGDVDLLLGHYGGAGPFPQCFPDLTLEEKVLKSRALAEVFLARLASAAKLTKAKFVMPYAGQYVLGGRLGSLNEWRSVVSLTEAVEWVASHSDSLAIAVKPFTSFDVNTGLVECPWVEPPEGEVREYVERISRISYPYEKARVDWDSASSDLRDALENVAQEYQRRTMLNVSYPAHRLSIETSIVSGYLDTDGQLTEVHVGALDEMRDQETRISGHPNLLKGLIQRAEGYRGFTPMHFNQAEIGSHFEWRRNGDYNEVVHCLNFLQTNGTLSLPLLRV